MLVEGLIRDRIVKHRSIIDIDHSNSEDRIESFGDLYLHFGCVNYGSAIIPARLDVLVRSWIYSWLLHWNHRSFSSNCIGSTFYLLGFVESEKENIALKLRFDY